MHGMWGEWGSFGTRDDVSYMYVNIFPHAFFSFLFLQIPMKEGINKTIEYFRNELIRKKHSERNLWQPEFMNLSLDKLGHL